MNNITKIKIGHDYVFTFGKYKGKSISEILENDFAYIVWCSKNIDWFELERDVKIDLVFNYISRIPLDFLGPPYYI